MDVQNIFKLWRITVTFYLTCMGVIILITENLKATKSIKSNRVQTHFFIYLILDTFQNLLQYSLFKKPINRESMIHHLFSLTGLGIYLYNQCCPPLWVGLMCIIECITVSRILLQFNIDEKIFLYIRKYLTLIVRIPAIIVGIISAFTIFWSNIPVSSRNVTIIVGIFLLCFDVYCLRVYNKKIEG